MKKFLLSFFLYLSLIGISYASNTIYLKCPQIITVNDSSEGSWTSPEPDLEEDWPLNVGGKFNTNFAKIKLGKSKSSITPYHYDWMSVNASDGTAFITNLTSKKSLGKPITAALWDQQIKKKTFKIKRDEKNNLVIDQSNKLMGLPTDDFNIMHKMTWSEKSGDWYFKEVLIGIVNNVKPAAIKLITEGKCNSISKENFSNYLKNGEGSGFFN